jgi:hypothetical protein
MDERGKSPDEMVERSPVAGSRAGCLRRLSHVFSLLNNHIIELSH